VLQSRIKVAHRLFVEVDDAPNVTFGVKKLGSEGFSRPIVSISAAHTDEVLE
jgi:hypothetical protein